jgi:hypothetical protein
MDELRRLIGSYDNYFEMYDDNASWRRGAAIHDRIRVLVKRLRTEGHGSEIDLLMAEHPDLVACPDGVHALA